MKKSDNCNINVQIGEHINISCKDVLEGIFFNFLCYYLYGYAYPHQMNKFMEFLQSLSKPHRAIGAETVSRWIKEGLRESGIDTSNFTGHSTRHAVSSKALERGIDIDTIRPTAGWSESYSRCRNRQSGCFATARVYRDNIDELINWRENSPSCIRSEEAVHGDVVARIVNNIRTIMIDSTYKTCPVVQDANLQLGTVMCVYHGHAIPVLWFLMSRKTTNAYRKLFSIIRELFETSNIVTIVTDFELPLRTALRETFGQGVYLIGCFFHFLRCLHGKLHRLGLTELVRDNEDANSFVRKCGALALVPDNLMLSIFDQMIGVTPDRILRPFQEFITYIRTFWFTRVGPRNFSVYGVHTRINNALESYHSVLAVRLGANPPFWSWVGRLKEVRGS
ncbi:unnamed protein product [Trichogramma brassicae]|uniref:MULE transposase domain-containing protein n=1 Tax=Trichogramma brassicae TaxID=86971 RepID=A0A6H5HWT7_9HYME|nr:unnamed protein product [Trichogramma brassicae]